MELELTSDQEFFAETTGRFLADSVPVQALREMRDDPVGFDRDYWRQGAELGWTSLLVDEEDGGGSISGGGVNDLALVAYGFGRHAAPGPLLSGNIVAAALSRGGTDAQRSDVLQSIISGETIGSWAWAEPRPHSGLGTVTVQAVSSGDGYVLSGVKGPVEYGANAEHFLVVARADGGLSQLLVPADATGVTVTPMQTVDLSRRFATVSFQDVHVDADGVVGDAGRAEPDVERQLHLALVIQLAEMVGAMDVAFEMTVDWAFNRYSFGRPLASYQELKHRFADMKVWLEASHAMADAAARAVQADAPDAAEIVSAGKAYVGQFGPELMHDCVQMHGGIGVTFDHDLHLYLRRVVLDTQLFGTVHEHRERLTGILEAREAAA
ncbi:MAG TPA: acyl-CoA dehydrogenase family protein [Acidimicrobiia bacterium]